MRAREVALHGVRHGAAVALAIAQVRSRHDLCPLQPDFPHGEDPDNYQDLMGDFEGAADAMANIILAKGVMNDVFFGP